MTDVTALPVEPCGGARASRFQACCPSNLFSGTADGSKLPRPPFSSPISLTARTVSAFLDTRLSAPDLDAGVGAAWLSGFELPGRAAGKCAAQITERATGRLR